MTFKERASAVRASVSTGQLLFQAGLSLCLTWLLVSLRVAEFLHENGVNSADISFASIALETLDAVTVFFSFLVFLVAGLVPVAILLVRVTPARARVAQVGWAATIVALLLVNWTISR